MSIHHKAHTHAAKHHHHHAPAPLILLPQAGGSGYYPYSSADRQYATTATVDTILEVCRQFQFSEPGMEAGIGDISFQAGGHMAPHHSHTNGRCFDVRPMRTDRMHAPVTIHDKAYDHAVTEMLIQEFLAHRNVRRILFNDASIKGVHPFVGHDNHFHVETRA